LPAIFSISTLHCHEPSSVLQSDFSRTCSCQQSLHLLGQSLCYKLWTRYAFNRFGLLMTSADLNQFRLWVAQQYSTLTSPTLSSKPQLTVLLLRQKSTLHPSRYVPTSMGHDSPKLLCILLIFSIRKSLTAKSSLAELPRQ
jgi:hypothetical protein